MVLAIGDRIDIPPGGESTTGGVAGKSVSFSSALPDTDYHVSFSMSAQARGLLGDSWYTKTVNGFTFYNDGAIGLAFTWSVARY